MSYSEFCICIIHGYVCAWIWILQILTPSMHLNPHIWKQTAQFRNPKTLATEWLLLYSTLTTGKVTQGGRVIHGPNMTRNLGWAPSSDQQHLQHFQLLWRGFDLNKAVETLQLWVPSPFLSLGYIVQSVAFYRRILKSWKQFEIDFSYFFPGKHCLTIWESYFLWLLIGMLGWQSQFCSKLVVFFENSQIWILSINKGC